MTPKQLRDLDLIANVIAIIFMIYLLVPLIQSVYHGFLWEQKNLQPWRYDGTTLGKSDGVEKSK